MPLKFFVIPIRDPDGEEELNAFLRSHRVLDVERHWVEQGANSFWSLCVDYLEPKPAGTITSQRQPSKGKVDYREVLSPEDFAVFSQLRAWRKETAAAEGIAVYLVFTNEQLAQMVQQRAGTKADLSKIDGVGQARVDKYGEAILEIMNRKREPALETDGKSV